MHQVSQVYMDILAGRYVVDMALLLADNRPAQICTDAELMAQNDPEHPENGPVYREDYIDRINTTASMFAGSIPEIGAVTSRSIKLSMRNPAQIIPRSARMIPYERIRNWNRASEWIPKGVYYIDTRDTDPGYEDHDGTPVQFLDIYGTDAMMKAEADYPEPLEEWPVAWPEEMGIALPQWPNALDISVLAEIAVFLGVEIEPETVAAINRGYRIPTNTDFCPREILNQIGVAYSGNLNLNDCGRLQLVPVNQAAARATVNIQENVDEFVFGEALAPVTRVVLATGEDGKTYTAAAPQDTGRTLTAELPWASQELAASVLADVEGMTYQPMTAKGAAIDPAVELGDALTVGGVTSRMYSQDLTFGEAAGSDIQSPADNDTDHEFTFKKKEARKTARAIGGVSRAVNEITEFDASGNRVVAKNSLTAVFDANGHFKSSELNLSVIEHDNGDGTTTLRSLADILADIITLQGNVKIDGTLEITDGTLIFHGLGGISTEKESESNIANLVTNSLSTSYFSATGDFRYKGNQYADEEITSTSGPRHLIGYK